MGFAGSPFVPKPTFNYKDWVSVASPKDDAQQTLAMAKMYQGIYNKPPQIDLGGITDIGSGLAKGLGNLANFVMYRQQQKAQDAYLSDLAAQMQEQQAAAQASMNSMLQNQMQQQADYEQAVYDTALNLAQGDRTPQTLAAAQLYGFGTPITNIANPVGNTLGAAIVQDMTGINQPVTDAKGVTMVPNPTPAQINMARAGLGFEPSTNLTLAGQFEDVRGKQLGNASTAYQLGVQPTKDALQMTGTQLENENKRIQNYLEGVNARFAADIKQAELDAKRTGTAEAQAKLQNMMQAQQLVQTSIQNGDMWNPQRIPVINAQLKSLGSTVDLIQGYKDLYNPKTGTSLAPTITKNAPKLPTPQAPMGTPGGGLKQLGNGYVYNPATGKTYKQK